MDTISKKRRSWNMSRIRYRDTKPEIQVRKLLFSKGYRYRVNYKISGKPDIAFPKQKVAIFVHGCFWHLHGCYNSVIPKSNRKFWLKKLKGNAKRDKENSKKLKKQGWAVIELWECQIEDRFERTTKKLLSLLRKKIK